MAATAVGAGAVVGTVRAATAVASAVTPPAAGTPAVPTSGTPATPARSAAPPTSSEVAVRVRRALTGDLTEGGVSDPREAVAYVVGYVERRYIPGRKAKGSDLSAADEKKLRDLLTPWRTVLSATSADEAFTQATAIESGKVGQLRDRLGALFSSVWTAEPAREKAIRVLEHAAAYFGGHGYPAISAKMHLGADTSSKAASPVFGALASAVTQYVEQKVETAKDVAAAAGGAVTAAVEGASATAAKALTGAVNVAAKIRDEVVTEAREGLATAKQAAVDLAQTGMTAVRDKIEAVENLAGRAADAVGDAKDALLAQARAVQEELRRDLATARETLAGAQKALVERVQAGLDKAEAAGAAALEAARRVPELLRNAVNEGVTGFRNLVGGVVEDPCLAVPGALKWACKILRGGWIPVALTALKVIAALVGLWLLWIKFRTGRTAHVAAKAIAAKAAAEAARAAA